MATPPSDDTIMLFKLLADGKWHDYEEIRDRIMASIPPGRALRKYDERIAYARKAKGDPYYDTEATEDERIYYGAKQCAQIVITSWKNRGLMYSGTGPNKQIRMKPGIKVYGVDVEIADPEAGPAAAEPEKAQEEQEVPEVPEVPAEPAEPSEVDQQAGNAGPAQAQDIYLRFTHWVCRDCGQFQDNGTACFRCGQPRMRAEEAEALAPAGPEQSAPPAASQAPETVEESEPIADDDLVPEYAGVLDDHEPVEEDAPSLGVTEAEFLERFTACRECSLLMVDEAAHLDWHRTLRSEAESKGKDEMALFAESEIRALLGEVIDASLDRFQTGMENFLAGQFSQLESLIRAKARSKDRWMN